MNRSTGDFGSPLIATTPQRTMRWLPRPGERNVPRLLLLLCLGQVLLWGVAVALAYRAPDVDSAEQFVWAESMQLGYLKHPPLPSWIMHGLLQVFGPSMALPVIAAQCCVVIALALTWRLGCEFMTPRRSLIATALTSLVTYHNIGGDSFNHNTVLLPFQAAMLLLFYLATRRGGWWRWALTGLFAALAMLVKYVALAPLAGMLLYFVLDRRLHERRALLGAALATTVFALVLLPHLVWLVSVDFMPLHYAQHVAEKVPGSLDRLPTVIDFLGTQVQRTLPFLLGLSFVFAGPRAGSQAPAASVSPPLPLLPSREDRSFIWLVAIAPLAIVLAIGLVGGTALAARWGANGFLLIGHVTLLLLLRKPDSPQLLKRTLRVVVLVQVLLCAGQTLGKTVIADWLAKPTRPNFPGAELADQARRTWQLHAGAPLRLVASDSWLGGNLIAHSAPGLAVMIDGSRLASPWVSRQSIDACGVLVLEDITHDRHTPTQPHPGIDTLLARSEFRGVWTLPWTGSRWRAPTTERGLIRWGIVAARPGMRCPIGAN